MDTEIKILVLTTGGTISSNKSEDGVKPNCEIIKEVISKTVDETNTSNIEVREVFSIDSTNMTMENENAIFEAVVKGINEGFGAIIITHGTDTLAFTASLLASRLNPRIPIIITGSAKIPSAYSTDAYGNMKTALEFAKKGIGGVWIAFDKKVIDGKFAYEMHPGSYDSFESPTGPFAEIGWSKMVVYNENINHNDTHEVIKNKPTGKKPNIVTVGLLPTTTEKDLSNQVKGADGVLLIGYGSLGIPKHLKLLLEKLANEMPVVLTAYAPTAMEEGFYEISKDAQEAGIIIGTGIITTDWSTLLVETEKEKSPELIRSSAIEAFKELKKELRDSIISRMDITQLPPSSLKKIKVE
jgi:L-asparaginase